MPKVNRNGQAAILTPEQLSGIFVHAHYPHSLMFQIAYYTAARIGEVCSLRAENWVGDYLVYEAANTKTGESRTARITTPLRSALGLDVSSGKILVVSAELKATVPFLMTG